MRQTQKDKSLSSNSIFGLSLSLIAPAIYALIIGPVFLKPKVDELTYILISFGVFWVLALGMLFFTLKIEKLSLITIGWQRLSLKWIFAAIGIGILLSLLVPVFTLLISMIIPSSQAGTIVEVTSSFSWWVIFLSVITAGITEEILFRGYPLERLLARFENKWVGACTCFGFFVAIHAAGWNFAHIVGVVIPLGIALTSLYLWRRNLMFVMIVHIMIDIPLVFMALMA